MAIKPDENEKFYKLWVAKYVFTEESKKILTENNISQNEALERMTYAFNHALKNPSELPELQVEVGYKLEEMTQDIEYDPKDNTQTAWKVWFQEHNQKYFNRYPDLNIIVYINGFNYGSAEYGCGALYPKTCMTIRGDAFLPGNEWRLNWAICHANGHNYDLPEPGFMGTPEDHSDSDCVMNSNYIPTRYCLKCLIKIRNFICNNITILNLRGCRKINEIIDNENK